MRVLQIQGLRAFAAIVVTFYHARLVPGGFIGVDIFYVISGYLITGLILRELDSTGRLNLSAFYQRRIKRLLPTSVFVLFATALVAWFVLPVITRNTLGRDLFAAAAYISNYLFAWWQNDYQNLNATPSPFIHYWSLAVEEQFYLIWPMLMILLAKYGRRAIILGISLITFFSLALSIYQTQTSPIWAFYSLPTRAWELGIGALLLFIPPHLFKNQIWPWLGISSILIASFRFDENTAFPGFNATLPVLATAVLIATIPVWPSIFNWLSNNRISQWLGKISYPLYLWHWPVLVIPSSAIGRPLHLNERIVCILATVLLADLTNRFIEEPLRHLKIPPRKVFLAALGSTLTSLVVGVFIATSGSAVISTPGNSSQTFNLAEVLAKPIIYSDGCHVLFAQAVSGPCTYGDTVSSTTIVLFGDSHAAQWFPTLEKIAKKHRIKLISLTKSACPSVDAQRTDQGAFKNSICKKWRENSIARIKALHPAAVIVSSYEYYSPPSGYPDRDKWWSDGQRKLLGAIKASSPHIIYISDTPHPLTDIPSCLSSRGADQCNSTKKTPADIVTGFTVINPTPWLCTSLCPAIKDSIVVYRDASHISVAMAIHLVPKLESALVVSGLFS